MTVSLTVVVALFVAYALCLVLTNGLWSLKLRATDAEIHKLEQLVAGQDRIIECQRASIDELHDAVFLIAGGERRHEPISSRVH